MRFFVDPSGGESVPVELESRVDPANYLASDGVSPAPELLEKLWRFLNGRLGNLSLIIVSSACSLID